MQSILWKINMNVQTGRSNNMTLNKLWINWDVVINASLHCQADCKHLLDEHNW